MGDDPRDDSIDGYFAAIDGGRHADLPSVFAGDATVSWPDGTSVNGLDGIVKRLDDRETRNYEHRVARRVHGTECAICEGEFTGETSDGTAFKGGFVDVFEFDADDRIARLSIYTRGV